MSKENLAVSGVFLSICVCFFVWGFGVSSSYIFFVIAAIFGIFLAFNIGANDVANAFGTSVGAKTLSIKQALIIAAIFEFSGAFFAGAEVTDTIRNGIVSIKDDINPKLMLYIMLSAMAAASVWIFIATFKSLPVSSTHSVVGAIIGAALALGFIDPLNASDISWMSVLKIVFSWVISPLMGGLLSYFVYSMIFRFIVLPTKQKTIALKKIKKEKDAYKEKYIDNFMQQEKPYQCSELYGILLGSNSEYNTKMKEFNRLEKGLNVHKILKQRIPILASLIALVISSMFFFKALKNVNTGLSEFSVSIIIVLICISAYIVCAGIINIMKKGEPKKAINRIFSWFQIFTACTFAFSHGANDISNAIGPFAAILDILSTGAVNANSPVPTFAMLVFAISLITGLWFLGKSVIKTVGKSLAKIKPTTGFSAEIASAIVILLATMLGIPISSTHILIGAVLGIGVFNHNANWKSMKPIGLAWAITLPASALISAAFMAFLLLVVGA